jgi:hypothetical protein
MSDWVRLLKAWNPPVVETKSGSMMSVLRKRRPTLPRRGDDRWAAPSLYSRAHENGKPRLPPCPTCQGERHMRTPSGIRACPTYGGSGVQVKSISELVEEKIAATTLVAQAEKHAALVEAIFDQDIVMPSGYPLDEIERQFQKAADARRPRPSRIR